MNSILICFNKCIQRLQMHLNRQIQTQIPVNLHETAGLIYRAKPKSLSWTPKASHAFRRLSKAFISAPLLIHSDPNKPFVVEVDASTNHVLSLQQGKPHPCAFFSPENFPQQQERSIGQKAHSERVVALPGGAPSFFLGIDRPSESQAHS